MFLNHACLICASPFGTRYGLCRFCGPRLFMSREPCQRQETGLRISSLFSWRRNGLPALNILIMNLKGKDLPEPWLEVATWFIQQFPPPETGVIVPVPGPHALGWARALSGWAQLPVVEALMKTSSSQNKRLGRAGRSKIRFSLRAELTPCTKYIIVDDIITTGATVRAAYGALGRPRNCEVWCLMDRRPWQGLEPLL